MLYFQPTTVERWTKNASKLCIILWGESLVTDHRSPYKRLAMWKAFPCDDVIMLQMDCNWNVSKGSWWIYLCRKKYSSSSKRNFFNLYPTLNNFIFSCKHPGTETYLRNKLPKSIDISCCAAVACAKLEFPSNRKQLIAIFMVYRGANLFSVCNLESPTLN